MQLNFLNWKKYQPRQDIKKPWWFAIDNDIFNDPKMAELSSEEFLTFFYFLCEASKANKNGAFFASREHHRVRNRMPNQVFDRTIKKLVQFKVLEQPRRRGKWESVGETSGTLQDTTIQNNTEQNKIQAESFAAQTGVALTHNSLLSEISLEGKMNAVSIWCSEYLRAYGFNYDVSKQDAGMLQNYSKGKSEERVQLAFACYFAIKEPFYEKAKHPVSLFFRDRAKIHAAACTGVDPSKPKPFDYSKLKD